MKIRFIDDSYCYNDDGYRVSPISDIIEVTQEEYDLLKIRFSIEVVQEKEWFLEQARKEKARRDEAHAKYLKEQEARRIKTEASKEKRKLAQLEKLKKELGVD